VQRRSEQVEIQPLAAADVGEARAGLVGVYAAAFGAAPYRESPQTAERFAVTLSTHPYRAGFRMRVARPASGEPVGFAYGYASAPGQWWHDRVAASIGGSAAARWLVGSFEVVELAVLPAWQGAGIGGRLMDALLDGVCHGTAVLSTLDAETPALHLYRRRGWRVVGDMASPTLGRFLIMGLDLPPADAVGSAP
jgi:ribosomal protein S18 acetylase RimI-like enzyme